MGLFNGRSFGLFSKYVYDNGDKYITGDRDITDNIQNVDIDYISGDVYLEVSESDSISIKETSKKDLDDDHKVHSYVEGTTLFIKYCASSKNINLNNLDKTLTVSIPKNVTLGNLKISVSSGNTAAVCSSDSIDLHTSSGNIDFTVVGNCTNLTANTSSGDVKLGLETADTVTISVASGSIDVDSDYIKSLDAKASSGDGTYTLRTVPENTQIKTSSGNITVNLPEEIDVTAQFKVVSGDVSYEQVFSKDGDTYVIGSGANNMNINAISGNIDIRILKL
jgi:DUF4097 and DUF4098 domain-containing protein YvlB